MSLGEISTSFIERLCLSVETNCHYVHDFSTLHAHLIFFTTYYFANFLSIHACVMGHTFFFIVQS